MCKDIEGHHNAHCRYGPTIAICFVLLVAAVKAIVEDKKRHDEDSKTNNSRAHVVLDDGTIQ